MVINVAIYENKIANLAKGFSFLLKHFWTLSTALRNYLQKFKDIKDLFCGIFDNDFKITILQIYIYILYKEICSRKKSFENNISKFSNEEKEI